MIEAARTTEAPASEAAPGAQPAVESDADFFAKAGPLPTAWDEARRFPRFYYRAKAKATVHPFRGGPQPPVECTVLTRDVSRGGLNLIHTEQLYPGQRIDLLLLDGVERSVEVCWCRRLANRCYSVGCRFKTGSQA
jgi:PilZ domain-containing protein